LFRQGQVDEGLAELERAVALEPETDLWRGQLGQACAMAGRIDAAREILRSLEDPSRSAPASPITSPTSTPASATQSAPSIVSSVRTRKAPEPCTASEAHFCSRRCASILASSRCSPRSTWHPGEPDSHRH
jgi:hypothetical protein